VDTVNIQHKDLASGRWDKFSFVEQMANIGSEIERTISWKHKGNTEYSAVAFDRALELIDLTIKDSNNRGRLKEIVRVREALADYFVFNNDYNTTEQLWQKYFFCFAFAARARR
jgi:hypothetical protein